MSTASQVEAWREIQPKLGNRQEQVLAIIKEPDGATLRELADRLGLDMSGVSPRVTELTDAGLVRDSGRTRLNAKSGKQITVWVPTGPKQIALFAAAA